ncbi:MAG: hypothetical protein JRH20_01540 [Deltaproteobacteria bacterium]|nr:hypothetical protein [Deltaproteobacteria bacterium]
MPIRQHRKTLILFLFTAPLMACTPKPKPVVPQKPLPVRPSAPIKVTTAKILFVDCKPADATVVVDEVPRGSIDELSMHGGLELPFGVHRILIRRRGYESYRVELSLEQKGERISIELKKKKKRQRRRR